MRVLWKLPFLTARELSCLLPASIKTGGCFCVSAAKQKYQPSLAQLQDQGLQKKEPISHDSLLEKNLTGLATLKSAVPVQKAEFFFFFFF